jgi:MurNAc alpha-1-phosphate uridylyltransferase
MNSDTLWTGINPLTLLMEQWNPETMDALLLCVSPENAVGRTGKKGDFSIGDDNVITRGGIYTYASCQIIKSQIVRTLARQFFHLTQFGTT